MAKANTITHTLAFPFAYNGEEFTEIVLRRPRGADMRKALNASGDGAGELTAKMIVNLSEIAPQALDEMDGEDWMALSVIVGNFMGGAKAGMPEATAP